MKTLPISLSYPKTDNIPFCAKKYGHITKKMLENNKTEKDKTLAAIKMAVSAGSLAIPTLNLDKILRNNGITYCKANDNMINIASGYNGGYYLVKTFYTPTDIAAKSFILQSFINDKNAIGGLKNYMAMVHDIKRQDIIQKGLQIHTYELNTKVPLAERSLAAAKLSKELKKDIKFEELFYINDDAIYYDKLTKTAYSIMLFTQKSSEKPNIKTCQFKTDENNNAIGYKIKYWDSYKWGYLEKEYLEQQEPSTKLKSIAERDNNKDFAEAFRFGNSIPDNNHYYFKTGIPIVLKHLKEKIGIENVNEKHLQFVNFYDKNEKIQSRICYYDPTVGRSFVYNLDGKYSSQLDYNRDPNGNIIACAVF